MANVQQAHRAPEGGCQISKKLLGGIDKTHLNAGAVRLLQFKGRNGLGVETLFDHRRVGAQGLVGDHFLMLLQHGLCLFSAVQSEIGLAQIVVSRRVKRIELNDFFELHGGRLPLSETLVGPSKLIADRIDGVINLLGDLKGFDGLFKVTLAYVGTTPQIVRCSCIGIQINGLTGLQDHLLCLVEEQQRIGVVQSGIQISAVGGHCLSEQLGGFLSSIEPLVQKILARLHDFHEASGLGFLLHAGGGFGVLDFLGGYVEEGKHPKHHQKEKKHKKPRRTLPGGRCFRIRTHRLKLNQPFLTASLEPCRRQIAWSPNPQLDRHWIRAGWSAPCVCAWPLLWPAPENPPW